MHENFIHGTKIFCFFTCLLDRGQFTEYLCANLFDQTNNLIFKPYTIKEISGKKIGIIGLLTGGYNLIARKSIRLETIVKDPLTILGDHIKELRGRVDCLIVAYHGGLSTSPKDNARYDYPNHENQAGEILQKYPSIDGLICGHQHFINQGINSDGTAYVQVGSRGQYLGKISFQLKNESLSIKESTVIPLKNSDFILKDEGYNNWLEQPVQLNNLKKFIKNEFQAQVYLLDFPEGISLKYLATYSKATFAFKRYHLSSEELKYFLNSTNLQADVNKEDFSLKNGQSYDILTTNNINLPTYRLTNEYAYNLFDHYVTKIR